MMRYCFKVSLTLGLVLFSNLHMRRTITLSNFVTLGFDVVGTQFNQIYNKGLVILYCFNAEFVCVISSQEMNSSALLMKNA